MRTTKANDKRERQRNQSIVSRVSVKSRNWTQQETQLRQVIPHKKAGLNARQLNRTQNVYVEVCIP